MCIIFPDVPFILSFSSPSPSLSVQPSNLPSLAHLPLFFPVSPSASPHLYSPLPPTPFSPSYPSSHQLHPSFSGSFGFVSHSVGWTDTGAQGWWEGGRGERNVGGGGVFEDKCGEGERTDVWYLKRKYLSKSREEDVQVLHWRQTNGRAESSWLRCDDKLKQGAV